MIYSFIPSFFLSRFVFAVMTNVNPSSDDPAYLSPAESSQTETADKHDKGIIVSTKTLSIRAAGAMGTEPITINGGTLRVTETFTDTNPLNIGTYNGAIDVAPNQTYTLSGNNNSSSAGLLAKMNSGTLVFSGINTYTGGTTIHGGGVALKKSGTLSPTGTVSISPGAFFDISAITPSSAIIGNLSGALGSTVNLGSKSLIIGDTNTTSFGGSIRGSGGSLIKQGSGTLILIGPNAYTGGTSIHEGVVALSGLGALSPSGIVEISTGAIFDISTSKASSTTIENLRGAADSTVALGSNTLILGSSSNTVFAGSIVGVDGFIVKQGSGTLTLTGTNLYTGGTIIHEGTVALNHLGTLPFLGTVSISSGSIFDISAISATSTTIGNLSGAAGSTVVLGSKSLTLGDANNTLFGGVIRGSGGSIIKRGAGTLAFSGVNTYTGSTLIEEGCLALSQLGAFSSSGFVGVSSGASFDISAISASSIAIGNLSGEANSKVVLGSKSLALGDVNNTLFEGSIEGLGGSIVKQGPGAFALSAANFHTGGTTIHKGSVVLKDLGSLPSSGMVQIDSGAVFDVSAITDSSTRIGDLSGAKSSTINLGSKSLILGDVQNTLFGGVINGFGGSVVKQGSGTLTLTGMNTYTGGTTINAGALSVGSMGKVGTGVITIDGGILAITGTFTDLNLLNIGTANGSIDVAPAHTYTLSGNNITPSSGLLRKTNLGTLALAGTHTYRGGTSIEGGSLVLSGLGALSSLGTVNLSSKTTFDISAIKSSFTTIGNVSGVAGSTIVLGAKSLVLGDANNSLFGGTIGGLGGGVVKQGSGTLTLTGANTYTGGTLINKGRVALSDSGSLSSSGVISIASEATFDISAVEASSVTIKNLSGASGSIVNLGSKSLVFGDTNSTSFGGAIEGLGGAIVKQGSGTLTLSGVNTYTGGTTIHAGSVVLKDAGAFPSSGAVHAFSGTTFDISAVEAASTTIGNLSGAVGSIVHLGSKSLILGDANNTVFEGSIGGLEGSVVKQGAGAFTLGGTNTYTGGTFIKEGSLILSSSGHLSSTGVISISSGATFDISAIAVSSITNKNLDGALGSIVNIGSKSFIFDDIGTTSFEGSIRGLGGSIIKQGSGTLILSGSNSYTGGTTIYAGNVVLKDAGTLSSLGVVSASSGTIFDISKIEAASITIGNLSGALGSIVNIGSKSLILGDANSSLFEGSIEGLEGSIVKQGSGTFTLRGANSYTGGTSINEGVLSIGGPGEIGTGPLTINGGIFAVTGTFADTNLLSIGPSNGSIDVAPTHTYTLTSNNTLSSSGLLTKTNSGTLVLTGVSTYTGGTIIHGGSIVLKDSGALSASGTVSLSSKTTFDISAITSSSTTVRNLSGGVKSILNLGSKSLILGDADSSLFEGSIGGLGGSIIKQGSGTLTLTGVNTYTGGTAVYGGSIALSSSGLLSSSGAITVFSGASFNISDIGASSITIGSLRGAPSSTVILGSKSFIFGDAASALFEGSIEGVGGSIVKQGSGILTLSGVNTYTGGTTIQEGSVVLKGAGSLPSSGTVSLSSATTFDINAITSSSTVIGNLYGVLGSTVNVGSKSLILGDANTTSFGGSIEGVGGSIIKQGSGTFALTGTNTYTGGTTINGGIISIGARGKMGTGPLTINGGALLVTGTYTDINPLNIGVSNGSIDVAPTHTYTLSGSSVIPSAGLLTKTNLGTLTLTGTNAYKGGTTIHGGSVVLKGLGSLSASGIVSLSSKTAFDISMITSSSTRIGNLHVAATSSVNLGSKSLILGDTHSTLMEGSIEGVGGSIVKQGPGTLILNGISTYTGGTTINGGTISVRAAGKMGTGPITLNGGTLAATETFTDTNLISIGPSNGSIDVAPNHTYTLTSNNKIPSTGLLVKMNSGTLTLTGAHAYAGGTVIRGGSVVLRDLGVLSSLGTVGVSSKAVFDIGATQASSTTIGNLSGALGSTVVLGSKTLIFGDANTTSFGGSIEGVGGSIVKQGAGTLILTGINTYTGGTTIHGGSVVLTNLAALSSSGTINISAGASFDVSMLSTASIRIGNLSGGAGSTVNLGSLSLALGDSKSTVFAGSIFDNGMKGSIVKQGPGTLMLTGANFYTGGTTIQEGSIVLSGLGAFSSSGPVNISSKAIFDVSAISTSFTTIGNLSGAVGSIVNLGSKSLTLGDANTSLFEGAIGGLGGSIVKQGSGTLVLSGANTYTGGTNINGGTVVLKGSGALSSSGIVRMYSGAALDISAIEACSTKIGNLNGAADSTLVLGSKSLLLGDVNSISFKGSIEGVGGAIVKQGSGTFILTGTSTYTGGTTIKEGSIALKDSGVLPSLGTVNISSGAAFDISASTLFSTTIGNLNGAAGSTVTLGSNSLILGDSNNTIFAGSIVDNVMGGSIVKQGSGTFTLTGTNLYAGGTTINEGTLSVEAPGKMGTGAITLSGGTLAATGTFTDINPLRIGASHGVIDVAPAQFYTLSGNSIVSSSGVLIKANSGTLIFSGTNTYSSGTIIQAGSIVLSGLGSLSSSGIINISSGAAFDISAISASSTTIGNLHGDLNSTLNVGSKTLVLGDANNTLFGGVVEGLEGSIIKEGAGTLTLSGANTYTGATMIKRGTVALSDLGALSSSRVVHVSSEANFDISAISTPSTTIKNLSGASGSKVILGSKSLTLGDANTSLFGGSIEGFGGALVKKGSGTFVLGGAHTYTGGTIINEGVIALTSLGALSSSGAVRISSGAAFDISTIEASSTTIGSLSGALGSVVNLGSKSLALGDTTTSLFEGTIEGLGGSIVKQGSGTLTLRGTNTYSGGTTIKEGALSVGMEEALGTGVITIHGGVLKVTETLIGINSLNVGSNHGSIDVAPTKIYTLSGSNSPSHAGVLTKTNSGTLTFTGMNAYTGDILVKEGSVVLSGSGSLSSSGMINIFSGAVFDISAITVSSTTIGNLSGSVGSMVELGSKSLFLGDANTTVFEGSIRSSGGTIVKQGSGVLALSGSSAHRGHTMINEGCLALRGSSSLHSSGTVNVAAGSIFDVSAISAASTTVGNISGASGSKVTLGSKSLIFGDANAALFGGSIEGVGGSIVKQGSGILTLSGASTYTGGTIINEGMVALSTLGALPSSGVVSLSPGAAFDVSAIEASSTTIGGLSGALGSIVNLGSKSLTLGDANTTAFRGSIEGLGGFIIKQGPGTLTLSGTNTYSGGTTIHEGSVVLSGSGILSSSGMIKIASGANFDISTLSAASTIIGNLSGAVNSRVILGSKSLIFGDANATLFEGSIEGLGGAIIKQGTGTLILSGANTYSGGTTIKEGSMLLRSSGLLSSTGVITISSGAIFDVSAISASSITIGNLTGDVSSNVHVGSKLLTLGNTNNTLFGGAIEGVGGSIVKQGSGILTLAGANRYTGGTTVCEGTLALSDLGALSSSGTVSLSSAATFDIRAISASSTTIGNLNGEAGSTLMLSSKSLILGDSNNTIFAGSINDSGNRGSVIKQGSGTLALTGSNNYSGGTTINAGVVSIAAGGKLGSGTVFINEGTLYVEGIFIDKNAIMLGASNSAIEVALGAYTLSGLIEGPGSLTKTGAGTLILSHANSYLGATTISAGAVQLAASNALAFVPTTIHGILDIDGQTATIGQLQGTGVITLGPLGALTINSNAASNFSGTITSLGGKLINTGGGTLTLTGVNTSFDGILTNEADTVLIGNHLSLSSAITNNGILEFSQSADGTYAGTINTVLHGTMHKQGAGNLNFTGSLAQDVVTVSAGTLSVNTDSFKVSSEITIHPSATLKGIGRITGNVINHGTLAPGNSIGEITIVGNYTQARGSTLAVEVAPSNQADHVTTNGIFTIEDGATFHLDPAFGTYPAKQTIQIVSAETVINQFSSVISDLPSFQAELVYLPTEIDLLLSVAPLNTLVSSGNPGAVAHCLDTLEAGSDLTNIINELHFMSVEQMTQTLEEMQPSLFKGFAITQQQNAVDITNTVVNRYQNGNVCSRDKKPFCNFWAAPLYSTLRQDAEDQEPGFHARNMAGILGVEFFPRHSSLIAGVAGAYSHSSVDWKKAAGKGSVATWYGIAHFSGLFPHFFFNTAILGGWSDYKGHRNIHFIPQRAGDFPAETRTATHHSSGYEASAHADFGAMVGKRLMMRPLLSLDYVFLHEGGYTEEGAQEADLKVQRSNDNYLRGKAGASFLSCFFRKSSCNVVPEVGIFYIYEWRPAGAHYNASFTSATCNMHVKGIYPNRGMISPTAKLSFQSAENPFQRISFSYQGEFGHHYQENEYLLELSCGF